jgi:shikimate dehydrogenase
MAAAPSRYVVAGNPVAHSQSPFIHATFAEQTGEPVVYERLLCAHDAFAATVRGFAAAGGSGCNVTMPFKFEAWALADRHSSRARLAGACNVLRFDADGWLGDNTDGAGLVRDIERNAGVALRDARVLVIGAGGGAAGALGPLIASGAHEVVVANRTVARARELVARHLQALGGAVAARVVATSLDDCGSAFDVVVNASASSVSAAPVPVAAAVLKRGTLALDMMYGAAARPFLAWAAAHGASGRDGLGMLVEQAAEAFFLWRGVEP